MGQHRQVWSLPGHSGYDGGKNKSLWTFDDVSRLVQFYGHCLRQGAPHDLITINHINHGQEPACGRRPFAGVFSNIRLV